MYYAFGKFGQRKSLGNFGNFCIETQNVCDFGEEKVKSWLFLSRKMPTHSTFDVGFSLGCHFHKDLSSHRHHFGNVGCTPLHKV